MEQQERLFEGINRFKPVIALQKNVLILEKERESFFKNIFIVSIISIIFKYYLFLNTL